MKKGRVDATVFRRKLDKLRDRLDLKKFEPELKEFGRRSFNTAARNTPARSLSLIRRNQRKQYEHRINYIPSYHQLVDPSLRVKGEKFWVYVGGKWYNLEWNLPNNIWGIAQALLSERERRMSTPLPQFTEERAQARFLHRRSWVQCGTSIGKNVNVSASVKASHSRHNPPKEPPRAHAQIRGGKYVLSLVAFNTFLEQQGQYWTMSGKTILRAAMTQHEPRLQQRFGYWISRAIYAIKLAAK